MSINKPKEDIVISQSKFDQKCPNLVSETQILEDVCWLHDKAEQEFRDFYLDPSTGFSVFTSNYHKKRGFCCDSGCRHCPYRVNTTPTF